MTTRSIYKIRKLNISEIFCYDTSPHTIQKIKPAMTIPRFQPFCFLPISFWEFMVGCRPWSREHSNNKHYGFRWWKMPYYLQQLGLMEIGRIGHDIEKLVESCQNVNEFARTLVSFFFDDFLDHETQTRSCVLVRFFQTRNYSNLDEHLKGIVDRSLHGHAANPQMKCLTLEATAGERTEWNHTTTSSSHQVIPLASESHIANIPMISQMIKEFGLDATTVLHPTPELLMDIGKRSFGVFFVEHALGSRHIPAQKAFVEPHGVRSVLGFGSMLPDGQLFVVILFSRVAIPLETTRLFRVIALNIKVGLFALASHQGLIGDPIDKYHNELKHHIHVHQELLKEYRETIIKQTEILANETALRMEQAATIGRHYESKLVINKLLETTLASQAFDPMLETLLDIIFSIPWFALYPKGSLFLLDPMTEMLELRAHRGFEPELLQKCSRLNLGQCLCGKAAMSGAMIFASHVDGRHDIHYQNMRDHGHYCVPIKSGERVLGVINLYVNAHHVSKPDEVEFLDSVATTLAGIIERKQLEKRIQQQAELDELTGLPNRSLFRNHLDRALRTAARNRTEVVLLFLDLDGFKKVNDTLGHHVGDRLLQEAAQRIAACVRDSDTVARMGGDEFTIIMSKLTHMFYVEYVARRIIEELEKPYRLTEGECLVSASIGIAVYPRDAVDPNELIADADMAMYRAKDAGRATFRFFEAAMTAEAMERLEIERALKLALERNELLVYYQPKINPMSGEMTGMEALVRWQRPGVGLLPPAKFIAVAEQTGLIIPIGEQVLTMACQQNKRWIDAGYKPCRVSVNLSARQLQIGAKWIHTVENVLAVTGLQPEYLELEITESMMMQNMGDAITTLEKIRAMGVYISVDDFGTGYSSLGSLKHLPVQILKIDRSFISGIAQNPDLRAIVSAILHMAKQLDLHVVAEGVETSDEVTILKDMGCHEIQGYFYSKPVPAAEFEKMLVRLA